MKTDHQSPSTSTSPLFSHELVVELEALGVRYLPTLQELQKNQTRMLANFTRAGVPHHKWKHLEQCDGTGCPHSACSAACWFGERITVLGLVRDAHALLSSTGSRLWFVTIVDPRYRQRPKRLRRLSLSAVQQGFRRRLRRLRKAYGNVRAVGAIEVCYDRDKDGRWSWGPHIHVVIAADCGKKALRKALRPHGVLAKHAKPIVIKEVTGLANALAYTMKRLPAQRVAFASPNGRQDRDKQGVRGKAELRHDRWLLGVKATQRLILCGVKRIHGRLSLLGGTTAVITPKQGE
ncbi:hypothetical protein [Methylobacterium sp. Leaf111]|uniref:hypothetical protein n=1 Tax=Methylobacterium sp. Leaf111 TaxID=1736257 RepID=UPI000A847290|nr:hypothetical protein [Methylobacterium sp. Leaf111]